MDTAKFIETAGELFENASNEADLLTVNCDYVAYVPTVGVVARVTMYVREPWTYSTGELLLLRSDDWQRAEGLQRRRRKGVRQGDAVWDEAEGVLGQLRDQIGRLTDTTAARVACDEGPAAHFGFEPASEFPDDGVTQDDRARRAAALERSMGRFDAAAAKMRDVYGLRLPRHVAVYDAFMNSLSPIEADAMKQLGRRPGGIMIWFEDGGLEREPRDGLDARLDCRFRCDPAELVTLMWGDSDGLHLGLWYDDPAGLPSFIAGNWARDSAETGKYAPTALRTLAELVDQRFSYGEIELPFSMGALRAALSDFMAEDDAAWAADGEPGHSGAEHAQLLGGICCAMPANAGDARSGYERQQERHTAYREDAAQVEQWAAQARRELEDGQPAFAMTLGRELWWLDSDDYRELATELLVGAYDALGRERHADLIRVHHTNRDLGSVAVY